MNALGQVLGPRQAYEWTHAVLWALRSALHDLGFVEILPAVLSSRFEPGARHSIAVLGHQAIPNVSKVRPRDGGDERVVVTGERHYYLPVSHVVEKQLALEHASRVYCMAPCVRVLMPGEHESGRHLYTFFQVELEWKTEDIRSVFATTEALLSLFSTTLLDTLPPASAEDPSVRERILSFTQTPYPRLAFSDAIGRVRRPANLDRPNPHNPNDLTFDEERRLSETFRVPFWVHDYPEGVRDSPYRRNVRGTYDSYDLLLPFGFGELATGGLRPESADEILRQSRLLGRDRHPDYAEWKDRTGIQSGGLGIGLERLVKYCCLSDSILPLRRYHDSGPNAEIEQEQP